MSNTAENFSIIGSSGASKQDTSLTTRVEELEAQMEGMKTTVKLAEDTRKVLTTFFQNIQRNIQNY